MKVTIYGYEAEMNTDAKLRKSFALKELANNKGDASQAQFIINADVDTFLDMIQEFRNWYAKPMTINCGYRQAAWNAKVGGDSRSAHLRATAIDWGIKGQTEAQRTHVKDKWAEICKAHKVIGAVNFYTNGYHLEAFSDKCYGSKAFAIRDYRGTNKDW